jgi:hypothetical protein
MENKRADLHTYICREKRSSRLKSRSERERGDAESYSLHTRRDFRCAAARRPAGHARRVAVDLRWHITSACAARARGEAGGRVACEAESSHVGRDPGGAAQRGGGAASHVSARA